jgi:Domain of unknown function (DUF4328)
MTVSPEPPAEPATPTPGPPTTFADQMTWQQAASRGPSPFRTATTRAKVLLGLLWANLVLSLMACAIDVWGWWLIDGFLPGRSTVEDLERFDGVHAAAGLAETALFIATAIAWLAWQSRTVDNEAPLGIGPSRWSPAASIVWWFVPFANLVQPYRIHRDMYGRYLGGAGVAAGLVLWWWLAYLASSLLANGAGRLWLAVETLEGLQSGLVLWFVADLATAIAVFPAVMLVSRIQRRSEVLASSVDAPSSPPAPSAAAS